jgi:hypothetical protein
MWLCSRLQVTACHNTRELVNEKVSLLPDSRWFLVLLIIRRWMCRQHVSPKRRLTFSRLHDIIKSRDSVVGIATGYGLDDWRVGIRVPVGSRIFCSRRRPDRLWGPHNVLCNGFPGIKRQGCEADHSPPASAEVKKTWIYTSTPPHAFMA